jgi:hypothetical protein
VYGVPLIGVNDSGLVWPQSVRIGSQARGYRQTPPFSAFAAHGPATARPAIHVMLTD